MINFDELEGWELLPFNVEVMVWEHFLKSNLTFEEYFAKYLVASHTAKQYATYVFNSIMTEAFK